MPACCVPACASGYPKNASSSDRHFFYAPFDLSLHSAKNKAVPRADKELTATSRVCDVHFRQDILKTYVHVIDEKSVEIPRGIWSLTKNAMPKVFSNLPAYLLKPLEKERKSMCKSAKKLTNQASEQHQGAQCYNLEQLEELPVQDAKVLMIANIT